MSDWQKAVLELHILESYILSVDESYRITLPLSLSKRTSWISGEQSHGGWLLLGSAGRCRLLSGAEADTDPDLQSLGTKIALELGVQSTNLLEFQDEVAAALALRLVPVEIKPRGPGWRFALPRTIAAIMQIRPKESDVVALFLQGHIEVWTIETLRSAVTPQLTQII